MTVYNISSICNILPQHSEKNVPKGKVAQQLQSQGQNKISSSYHRLITMPCILFIKETDIMNIVSPISNQNVFVFNETLLPILAPIIDPVITNNAGSQIIFLL